MATTKSGMWHVSLVLRTWMQFYVIMLHICELVLVLVPWDNRNVWADFSCHIEWPTAHVHLNFAVCIVCQTGSTVSSGICLHWLLEQLILLCNHLSGELLAYFETIFLTMSLIGYERNSFQPRVLQCVSNWIWDQSSRPSKTNGLVVWASA